MDLKFDLEDLFQKKVDLVISDDIKPALKPESLSSANCSREPKVYLEDIYAAAVKIKNFTNGLSYDEFLENELVSDAVIKNILVIGEATKKIPEEIQKAGISI